MGITDIFWAFLIISAIQPVIQKKLQEVGRLRLLRDFERKRGSLTIALIHRQETMSFLGFPRGRDLLPPRVGNPPAFGCGAA